MEIVNGLDFTVIWDGENLTQIGKNIQRPNAFDTEEMEEVFYQIFSRRNVSFFGKIHNSLFYVLDISLDNVFLNGDELYELVDILGLETGN